MIALMIAKFSHRLLMWCKGKDAIIHTNAFFNHLTNKFSQPHESMASSTQINSTREISNIYVDNVVLFFQLGENIWRFVNKLYECAFFLA